MRRLTERRLLAAAVATIILLVARVFVGRPLAAWRRSDGAAAEWWDETPEQAVQRRLAAVEANLVTVWEALNARGTQDR